MASAWGSSWGSAWGNSWGTIVSALRTPTAPNLPGGGAQGIRRGQSAMQLRAVRQRREEDEVAMILQAVMPLIDAQADTQQTIILGERDGVKYS